MNSVKSKVWVNIKNIVTKFHNNDRELHYILIVGEWLGKKQKLESHEFGN